MTLALVLWLDNDVIHVRDSLTRPLLNGDPDPAYVYLIRRIAKTPVPNINIHMWDCWAQKTYPTYVAATALRI